MIAAALHAAGLTMTDFHGDIPIEGHSQQFKFYGERVYHGVSPLYEVISLHVARDSEILALVGCPRRPSLPNILLAAVHFLLLRGAQHPLAAFYPSVSQTSETAGDVYRHFRSFCLEHKDSIQALVSSRLGQTNEVRRCAHLLPAFGLIARRSAGAALGLVDIGASAGLLLLWDKYRYDFGDGRIYGDPTSPVQIDCKLLGDLRPQFPDPLPEVSFRKGIDLQPVDLHDPDELLWLRACIWPEHRDRDELLQAAAGVWQRDPPEVTPGDAIEDLARLVKEVPEDSSLCIFHSEVFRQQPQDVHDEFNRTVADLGKSRDLFWLSAEHPNLELKTFKHGKMTKETLAKLETHGREFEWILEP